VREQTANRQTKIGNRICQACGARARRKFARYCLDCGKSLWEEYQPLDHLRSSYRLQNKQFQTVAELEEKPLFEKPENTALEFSWAFLVYSMIPYLGILFTPGAILMSSVGAVNSCRRLQFGNLKSALFNITLSVAILVVQLFLWWLFYIAPEFGKTN
jgi:hypothetical protein